MGKTRRARAGGGAGGASPSGASKAAAPEREKGAQELLGNDAVQEVVREQQGGHDGEQAQGDIWDLLSTDVTDIDWSWANPSNWFGRGEEINGPSNPELDTPALDTPEISTPEITTPTVDEEIDTPAVDTPEVVVDGPAVDTEVVEEVVKEVAEVDVAEVDVGPPDLALRPASVTKGMFGALILRGGGEIDIKSSGAADASSKGTVADGTACEVIEVSGEFAKVAYRNGSKKDEGWVHTSVFSNQPRLFHDDDNKELMEDHTWTHVGDDQSTTELAGSDVEQGGLADCYFIAAMNAVGNANPDFLEQSVKFDASTGMYKVRFFEEAGYDRSTGQKKTQEVWIEVDGYLPTKGSSKNGAYASAASGKTQWGAIIEKAYAVWKGGYNVMGDGGYGSEAMEQLTGNPSDYSNTSSLSEDEVIPYFTKAKEQGLAIYTGSHSSMAFETQTPLTGDAEKGYSGKVKQSHDWNHMEPGTVTVTDTSGVVGTANDTGKEGDKKAGFRGRDVAAGEIDFKGNEMSIRYASNKGPEDASSLEVAGEFKGMLNASKQVIGWHGYSFDKIVNGNMIQLYNPWGSWQPKPLTPAEYLTYYGSLSTVQVPQAKGNS